MLKKLAIKALCYVFSLIFVLACSLLIHSPLHADTLVKTHDGEQKNFFADIIQDHPVIVNFVYTRCEGVCPGQGQRFKILQDILEKRGDASRVKLVSISIDPERDSPSDLKQWADSYGRQKNWTLVVSDRASTDKLLREILGMTLTSSEHSPFVAIRDKEGKWQSLYGLSSPKEILKRFDAAQKSSSPSSDKGES